MNSFIPQALGFLGGAFSLVGGAVLFLDLRSNSTEETRRRVEIYMERLQQTLDEMAKSPIPPGAGTVHGQDLGEIWDIVKAGGEQANAINRNLHLELLETIDRDVAKHRRAATWATALVITGGILPLIAWWLN